MTGGVPAIQPIINRGEGSEMAMGRTSECVQIKEPLPWWCARLSGRQGVVVQAINLTEG